MENIYKNDALIALLSNKDILPNSLLTHISIYSGENNEDVNISLRFNTYSDKKIKEIKITFFNVHEYGFYHNSKVNFYNIDYYKFIKTNEGEYYMSLDPCDNEDGIGKDDNDFIKAEKIEGETFTL